ncbi:unnamed protein product [Lymnaea stagnalis]|uniref:Uncharacterized protein n=1 Tax=Lymnaea stagnalis TaxID=6523 RepID=A0AAV2ILN4_LYMST
MINTTSDVNTTSGVHSVVSKNYLRFGCYIYGHGPLFGYMHPAGFQACDTVTDKPKMTVGDGIDNDCDGHIDEEYENRMDDDSDGLIDEDNRKFRKRCPKPYTWGPHCERSCINCAEDCIEDNGACSHCKDGFKNSFGGCDNACEEYEYGKDCLGSCIDKCGRDCINRSTGECEACPLNFTWGPNCDQSCIHCIDDCDDVTGRCPRCHVGYKNAILGCNKECEVNEYGEDCAGSCFHKCGGDCVDRRSGKCEPKEETGSTPWQKMPSTSGG